MQIFREQKICKHSCHAKNGAAGKRFSVAPFLQQNTGTSLLLEQLEAVIAPMGLTPEVLAVKSFEFCVDPATQELAISLLLKWRAEQEAEGENLGGGL